MTYFNIEELRELYFHLSIDQEALVGANPTKRNLSLTLIETCQRQGLIPTLLSQCNQLRPQSFPAEIDYVAGPETLPMPSQAAGCYIVLGQFKFTLILSLPILFLFTFYGFISLLLFVSNSYGSPVGIAVIASPNSQPSILHIGLDTLIYGTLSGLIQWRVLLVNGQRAKWQLLVGINIAALLAGGFLALIPTIGDFILAPLVIAVVQWRFFWWEISGRLWTAALVGLTFSASSLLGLLVMIAVLAWLVFSPRMNKIRLAFILILPFIFIFSASLLLFNYAEIVSLSHADDVSVAENETIDGDLFTFGDVAVADGATINGDVLLVGGDLSLGTAVVMGDVVLVGGALKMVEESVIQGRCFAYQIGQRSTINNQTSCQGGLMPLPTAWKVILPLMRLSWGALLFLFALGAIWIFLLFSPKSRPAY